MPAHAPHCPHCESSRPLAVRKDLENFWRVFRNVVLFLSLGFPVVPLKRHCRDCGALFSGSWWKPPRKGLCGIRGYDPTGNVSGVCPECGWKIPRRFRSESPTT